VKFVDDLQLQNYFGGTSNEQGVLEITIEAQAAGGTANITVTVSGVEVDGALMTRDWRVVVP